MSKKKLILIPALLMALTACGPSTSAPTSEPTTEPTVSTPTTETAPTVEVTATKIEITNKDELAATWFVGDADRNVNYTITYSDGSTKARGATIESSNPEVVGCPGGVKIHANGKGTATITVKVDSLTDSVEVTVDELAKEETVTVAELLNKPVNDATAYIVTGYIVSWQSGKTDATAYGNFIIADSAEAKAEDGILVYGATLHADSLVYDETLKTWSWSNPNSNKENPRPFPFADYKIGDKVTMKGLRLDYNTTKEFNGIITEHVPVQKDPVTEVTFKTKTTSIGNGYSFTFKALDNNEDEDVVYTLEGDAATLKGATVTADATKTGKVTLTATHKSNAEIKASVEINIVANPEIVDATLEEVINDEGTKGNKLFRVTAKTVANASTKDGDQYGNFDYTDGTNTITSYGLSANASTISYYGDIWNFKNDKSFQNTGVEIGSDNEYTVIVMRSDYKGTKQLVGYIAPTAEEETYESLALTVDSLGLAADSYTAGTATVDGVEFAYTELGNYGAGIQMRVKEGRVSSLANTTAIAGTIKSIDVVLHSTKSVYDNADAFAFKFGADATVAGETISFSTVKDQYNYTFEPTVEASFFSITKTIESYSFYFESITVNYAPAESGSDTPVDGEITKTTVIADYADANAWANSTLYDTITVDENITVKATGTPVGDWWLNSGKYYENGENWRIYQNENPEVTFTAAEGYEIVSITVEYAIKNTGTLTFGGENVASGTLVSINAATATFSVGNTGDATNGQAQITGFTVVYAAK